MDASIWYEDQLRAAERVLTDRFNQNAMYFAAGCFTAAQWRAADREAQAEFDLAVASAAALRDLQGEPSHGA